MTGLLLAPVVVCAVAVLSSCGSASTTTVLQAGASSPSTPSPSAALAGTPSPSAALPSPASAGPYTERQLLKAAEQVYLFTESDPTWARSVTRYSVAAISRDHPGTLHVLATWLPTAPPPGPCRDALLETLLDSARRANTWSIPVLLDEGSALPA